MPWVRRTPEPGRPSSSAPVRRVDPEAEALEAFVAGRPYGYAPDSSLGRYANGRRPRDEAERLKWEQWERLGLPRFGSGRGGLLVEPGHQADDL